jgi:ferredoxin
MLYINSAQCVECGACEPVCPVESIYHELPRGRSPPSPRSRSQSPGPTQSSARGCTPGRAPLDDPDTPRDHLLVACLPACTPGGIGEIPYPSGTHRPSHATYPLTAKFQSDSPKRRDHGHSIVRMSALCIERSTHPVSASRPPSGPTASLQMPSLLWFSKCLWGPPLPLAARRGTRRLNATVPARWAAIPCPGSPARWSRR